MKISKSSLNKVKVILISRVGNYSKHKISEILLIDVSIKRRRLKWKISENSHKIKIIVLYFLRKIIIYSSLKNLFWNNRKEIKISFPTFLEKNFPHQNNYFKKSKLFKSQRKKLKKWLSQLLSKIDFSQLVCYFKKKRGWLVMVVYGKNWEKSS